MIFTQSSFDGLGGGGVGNIQLEEEDTQYLTDASCLEPQYVWTSGLKSTGSILVYLYVGLVGQCILEHLHYIYFVHNFAVWERTIYSPISIAYTCVITIVFKTLYQNYLVLVLWLICDMQQICDLPVFYICIHSMFSCQMFYASVKQGSNVCLLKYVTLKIWGLNA